MTRAEFLQGLKTELEGRVPYSVIQENIRYYDSYILDINNGVIAVLGKDTDAAFHGLTSLKHIFNQVKDNNILNDKSHRFRVRFLNTA